MKIIRSIALLLFIGLIALSSAAQVPKPVEIKIAPATFDAYVGQYQDARDPEMIFSIFREDSHFYVQPTAQGKVEIFAESDSRLF